MKSLSLREKLVLGLVAAVVVIALISILVPANGTSTAAQVDQHAADLNDFSVQLALKMAQNSISGFEAAALEKAAVAWQVDPFLDVQRQDAIPDGHPGSPATADTTAADQLSYTGFVQMGQRILAVINGLEYEVGERLAEHPGLILQRISKQHVVLVRLETGAELVLPMKED